MPLAAATRLGPYEIVSPLGAGGMGEVYRARDARLGREVAIKVLPAHLASDPELKSRFEREAKTISSLNHPHICTLHDIGREGDTDYLVMELLEGETLAHRLERGPMAIPEVLKVGAQIADALDRAHRLGVIHRDLKPGNVMLTRSGAKLMDFGLARPVNTSVFASGDGLTVAAPAQSRTAAEPLTARGTIVGTFLYMAPEQLEGKDADTRSDIWALGCVLYEMATGTRAFDGKSQASIVGAIMSSEPTPVSQVSTLAPAALDRLIRDCLRKDPEDRIQTAHDVKLQLLGIAEGASQIGAPAIPRKRGAPRAALAWVIAAIAIAALVWALATRNARAPQVTQLSITAPAGAQFTFHSASAVISPDGSAVALAAVDTSGHYGIWLQRFDSPEPVRLNTMDDLPMLFWSPDSRSIGFTDVGGSKRLATISVNGGAPSILATDAGTGRGASWSRKGVIIFQPSPQGPLYRIPASGGHPEQASWLDTTRHEETHRFPFFLPDGEHFLFVALPPGPEGYQIEVGSLRSRAVTLVMTADSAPIYADPGLLVFRRGGKIMAQGFDAAALRLRGAPFALGEAPEISDIDAEPVASASRNGRLVYLFAQPLPKELEWLDRNGAVTGGLSLPPDDWARPILSPDDRFVVCRNGNELWRVDVSRSVATRLASGERNSNPVWSPDGRKIAFALSHEGRQEIYEIPSDGSADATLVPTTPDLFKWPEDWTSAGLVLQTIGKDTGRDLWILPDGGTARPLIRTRFSDWNARVSPDGHWIAYLSNEGGLDDVYLQSFPEVGHKVRVSTTGATRIWWMSSSTELCYRWGDQMMSVPLTRHGDDMEPGAPRLLFRYPQDVTESEFSHDGRRILISAPVPGAQKRKVNVILDWTALDKP